MFDLLDFKKKTTNYINVFFCCSLKRGSLFFEEELPKTLRELDFEEGGIRLRLQKGVFPKIGNISLSIILQSYLLQDSAKKNTKVNITCSLNITLNDLYIFLNFSVFEKYVN